MIKSDHFILGIILALLFVGCDKNENNSFKSDVQYIKYGTSFGECLGYCENDIKVMSSTIDFHKSGWDLEGVLPEKSQTENIDKHYWTELNNKINFDAFMRLDSIIGCPDCADGGSEWIEIKSNGKLYKVVFEYHNEPNEVSEYIGYLRTFLNAFQIDSNENVAFNTRTLINQRGFVKNFVSSKGIYQYLIGITNDQDTTYYYDKYLPHDFQADNFKIKFNGVLQYDSTMIYKPAPGDIPIPDFKARNINTFDLETTTE